MAGPTVALIVKVDTSAAGNPAAHVRRILDAAHIADVGVEELFPGLRTGPSAGLVSVTLRRDSPETQEAATTALRNAEGILYVEEPKRRKPRR